MPHQDSGLVELPPVVPFDLRAAKSRVPAVRPGSVHRTPLVNRLRGSGSRPVVTVLAPAGYGKSTVLAQWSDRDRRPFVWVSIDDDDNDPSVFSEYVTSALSRAPPRRRTPWLDHSLAPATHGCVLLGSASARARTRRRPLAPIPEVRGGRGRTRRPGSRRIDARARRPQPAAAADRTNAGGRSTLRGRRRGPRAEPPRGRSRRTQPRGGARRS